MHEYQKKLLTAEAAVQLLPKKGVLGVALGSSCPPMLLGAIEQRVARHEIESLRLYYLHPGAPLQNTLLKYEYMDIIKPYTFFPGKADREILMKGLQEGRKLVNFIPGNLRLVPKIFRENVNLDVFVLTVSEMTSGGYFSVGANPNYALAAAQSAKTLVVEVNKNMPCVFGDTFIHISDVDAIVENHVDLPSEASWKEPSEIDFQIADHVMSIFTDASCLQIGIGNVPNAVCTKLKNFNDLSIHSELLSTAMVDLIQQGVVTNRYKTIQKGKSVFTTAWGDKAFYDFIHLNPSIEGYPCDYTNNPHVIGLNDNVFSLNSFVEIDLFGQVNAEFVRGHQYSTVGGQLDFIEGALQSKGGRSVLAATSTAGNGKISRIVDKLSGPVTDTRHSVQYVATEYGLVNLLGKSTQERAELLISIAHPSVREELKAQAKKLGMF